MSPAQDGAQNNAPLTDLATARATFAHLKACAQAQGLPLRNPPPEPTTCCGRGCNGCVWEGYFTAANNWREDALAALHQALAPDSQTRKV